MCIFVSVCKREVGVVMYALSGLSGCWPYGASKRLGVPCCYCIFPDLSQAEAEDDIPTPAVKSVGPVTERSLVQIPELIS